MLHGCCCICICTACSCTAVQLYHLEDCNSHLLDDTDGLWKTHCQRDFKKSAPAENQSWRELYLEKFEEREEKFKTLTARISRKKMEMEKEMEGKQVKLAKATVMRRSYYSSSSSSFSSRSGRHSPLKGPSQPTGPPLMAKVKKMMVNQRQMGLWARRK
eukprot:m.49178 g.49178  ORF g.49178 m.49178 type:complete len:159 (+) comp33958_c0_seq22:861-1337(+)